MSSKKVNYCANHPEVAATESCHQCSKEICFNCQYDAFDHTFCSVHCIGAFMGKVLGKGIFRFFYGIVWLIFWPFQKLAKSKSRVWIEVFLVLGLLACFFFIWNLSQHIAALESGKPIDFSPFSVTDTSQIAAPFVFEPTEGGMVYSHEIDIRGEAEDNRIVSLSIDGKLKDVLIPENGKFAFEKIRLHRGNNQVEIRALSQDGRVSLLETMTLNYATATLAYLSKDFRRGSLNQKKVAITFDGGSVNNAADEILKILKDYNVKSTFFLTGEFIKNYPGTVKQITAGGHEVGNHTWTHPHLTTFSENRKHTTLPDISEKKIREEFRKTASLFQTLTGKEMVRLWRAPFGEYNQEILNWAASAGYKHVGWTVGRGWEETMDTMDWVADKNSQAYHSSDEIVEKILNYSNGRKNGTNGAIILMHLGTQRKEDFPHQKLPEIIQGLRDKGYELVKVTEMMVL